MVKFLERISKISSWVIIVFIKMYQYSISPWLGNQCRYIPTCSEYSVQALKKYGVIKGMRLSIQRILSCRPNGKSGLDPLK